MALCSYDEAFTIPSEHAALLSLRTMQILMEETGVCDTVDPLAGSKFVEATTNEMEQRIARIMEDLEKEGGIVKAVASGSVQAAVNRQAYEMERRIQKGEVRKVGVNCHRDEGEAPDVEFHPYREEEAKRQIERLRAVRARRDQRAVERCLTRLGDAARQGGNVMPARHMPSTAFCSMLTCRGRTSGATTRYISAGHNRNLRWLYRTPAGRPAFDLFC